MLGGRAVASSQAWAEIGGKRFYSRSKAERNYARYLEWLKSKKLILDWEYEPVEFWFEKIRRGVRSYKPDFRVVERNNPVPTYHEVKGWMDPKSKTKLKRMAKYYPAVQVILITRKEIANIRKLGAFIPGLE